MKQSKEVEVMEMAKVMKHIDIYMCDVCNIELNPGGKWFAKDCKYHHVCSFCGSSRFNNEHYCADHITRLLVEDEWFDGDYVPTYVYLCPKCYETHKEAADKVSVFFATICRMKREIAPFIDDLKSRIKHMEEP